MTFQITCKQIPNFESERLLFRISTNSDRQALIDIQKSNFEKDYIKSAWGMPPNLVTHEICEKFIHKKIEINEKQMQTGFEKVTSLFISIYRKDNGQLVGSMEVYVTKQDVEMGIFIDMNQKNMGFATEATKAFIEFAKKNTNIRMIIFSCKSDNLASLKVAKKCEFERKLTYQLYPGCQVEEFQFAF